RRKPPSALPRLVNPYDETASLDARARSYLHVNCAHCHQFGAGGTAEIDLRHDVPLEQTKLLGVRPVQGTFDIPDARLIAPGDPYRSVLFYRLSKLGQGRMPMAGSEVLDDRGLRLIHDWIAQLPAHAASAALLDQLRAAGPGRKRAEIIDQLLRNTSSALFLARTLRENGLPAAVRDEVIAAALARPEAPIRDLFEPFVPEEKRVRRLGSAIQPALILARKGDAARGRDLFFNHATLQCRNCHRIHGVGNGTLGPDLSDIGKKYDRAQLLESILEPSKTIDPKYVAYVVATKSGRNLTGLLVSKTDTEVILRDAQDKEHRIPLKEVDQMVPQKQSFMPELLLRDLTAEQAADLLAFLESLK
ncbi:MAG TPA: c-type cytochrome, partial [Gemmataceae bacterium]|nr:c-type cytochrome [Gemmataceae bacterium]